MKQIKENLVFALKALDKRKAHSYICSEAKEEIIEEMTFDLLRCIDNLKIANVNLQHENDELENELIKYRSIYEKVHRVVA